VSRIGTSASAWLGDACRVLDALPSAVLVLDEHGVARYANKRAALIFGLPAEELVGKHLVRDFGWPDVVASASSAPGNTQWTTKFPNRRGDLVTIGYGVSRLEGDGAPLYTVSFRDISETVALTRERDRLLQLAAVAESMPTLLHEVRNPLSAIITTVELILEDIEPGELRNSLHAVLGEARRIGLQLDGVGSVGRSLRSRRAAAIDQACREICTVMASRAEKSNIYLRWDIPDLPLLPLEPATVRAVLFNLITNSIHACRPHDTIRVHARLVRGGTWLELVVVDTGQGMSAEAYRRCTDLFFTTKRHGSGIGLALCQRAIRSAGGEIEIESIPDVGTSVAMIIPVDRRALADSEPPP